MRIKSIGTFTFRARSRASSPAEKIDSEISGVLEQALLLRADDRVVLDDEDAFA
jgi:hypothetical protein